MADGIAARSMSLASITTPPHQRVKVNEKPPVAETLKLPKDVEKRARELVAEILKYAEPVKADQVSTLYCQVVDIITEPLLQAVLRKTEWNQSRATRVLGINRGTLRRMLQRYGMS